MQLFGIPVVNVEYLNCYISKAAAAIVTELSLI